jgi:SAM-dependent methyltransferase
MSDDAPNARSFDQRSDHYARYRPRYPDSLFDYLAALAPDRARALDVGTGNGQAAVALAARFEHVLATDPSAEQIAAAEPRPNIAYRVLAAEDTDIAPETVSLITVAQALHWFALDRFYPAIEWAMEPRAVFAAFGYYAFTVEPDTDTELGLVVRDAIVAPRAAGGTPTAYGAGDRRRRCRWARRSRRGGWTRVRRRPGPPDPERVRPPCLMSDAPARVRGSPRGSSHWSRRLSCSEQGTDVKVAGDRVVGAGDRSVRAAIGMSRAAIGMSRAGEAMAAPPWAVAGPSREMAAPPWALAVPP